MSSLEVLVLICCAIDMQKRDKVPHFSSIQFYGDLTLKRTRSSFRECLLLLFSGNAAGLGSVCGVEQVQILISSNEIR